MTVGSQSFRLVGHNLDAVFLGQPHRRLALSCSTSPPASILSATEAITAALSRHFRLLKVNGCIRSNHSRSSSSPCRGRRLYMVEQRITTPTPAPVPSIATTTILSIIKDYPWARSSLLTCLTGYSEVNNTPCRD